MGSNLRSEPRHLSLPHSQEGLKITPILTPESELSSTQRQRRSQVPVHECCRSGGQTGLRVLTGMDRGGHPAPKYSMQSLPFSCFFFFFYLFGSSLQRLSLLGTFGEVICLGLVCLFVLLEVCDTICASEFWEAFTVTRLPFRQRTQISMASIAVLCLVPW